MPVQSDLTVIEGNTETINVTVTTAAGGDPMDLTGVEVEYLIKPDPGTDDSYATVLSTATGEITITDAAAGQCQIALPAQQAGVWWRRLDIVAGRNRRTAVYGQLIVVDV